MSLERAQLIETTGEANHRETRLGETSEAADGNHAKHCGCTPSYPHFHRSRHLVPGGRSDICSPVHAPSAPQGPVRKQEQGDTGYDSRLGDLLHNGGVAPPDQSAGRERRNRHGAALHCCARQASSGVSTRGTSAISGALLFVISSSRSLF